MSGARAPLAAASPEEMALRDSFLRWQCRVRQIAMREASGRPDDAVTPALTLPGQDAPMGHIITVLSRNWANSRTPELQHLCRATNDPAQRRSKALALFSETYYQQPREFTDTLTATFPPCSPGAAAIEAAGACRLAFDAYSQRFDLYCAVRRLDRSHPLHQATWWHNLMFNPNLNPGTIILAFKPDWSRSSATRPL
jgi:hypothetical protein